MKIRLEFKLQDMWIGVFWKTYGTYYKHIDIWICIVPCFPIHIEHRSTKP